MRLIGKFLLFFIFLANTSANDLKIYIDADFSNYYQSSRSIEVGILSSLTYHKKLFPKTEISVQRLDHRSNNRRSLSNLKKAMSDPKALAVFCGMHSPPVLANRDFINDNKILLMDPWAAAAPITRSKSQENYIFRLSVDDRTAGQFLIEQAISKHHSKRPYLLLEDTAWGKNNWHTLSKAISKNNIINAGTSWFKWNLSNHAINKLISDLKKANADCIILVANANESVRIVNALASHDILTPVISHWGLTGGVFHEKLTQKGRKISLSFIQTSLDLYNSRNHQIIKSSIKLFPNDFKNNYIKAPSGFVHAHDLCSLLLHASKDHFDKRSTELRQAVKNELENLNAPIKGLIKVYSKPFSKYSISKPFSHEALRSSDYRMAFYDDNGIIRHRQGP